MSPTCVELFAGCGGASLGLRSAGFRSVLQAEWDPDACATLRASGFTDVFEGDVREAPLGGLGHVDLLWASPPCQPFSSMGKRSGAFDDRNGWPWTFDALERLREAESNPTWVICENVLGLTLHADGCGREGDETCRGCYWEHHVVAKFREAYAHVDWRVLDAADYGVPQHRERVFLVAGPTPFVWPTPTHSQRALVHAKWVTGVYWRERGLEPTREGPSPSERAALTPALIHGNTPPERPWVTVRDAVGLTKAIRVENTSAVSRSVDEVAPTLGTRGVLYTHPRPGEPRREGIRLMSIEGPQGQGSEDWLEALELLGTPVESHRAPEDRRRVSVVETCTLQGFASDLPLVGDMASRYRQVGNAVPPLLAEHLGCAVLRAVAPL